MIFIFLDNTTEEFYKKLLKQAIIKKFEYSESSDRLNNIDEIMEEKSKLSGYYIAYDGMKINI